jgi:hypothetical protein
MTPSRMNQRRFSLVFKNVHHTQTLLQAIENKYSTTSSHRFLSLNAHQQGK